MIAAGLGDFANARGLFENFLCLLDDALAERRDRHFALAALE